MSAFTFARQAFGKEKPHSSITAWVDILTSPNIEEEAYDGIPELVDSINLQSAGPTEASRALRKKLKHGTPHQQYRALVLLKALVENCGPKFHSTFADGQLTDALKQLANDTNANKRVRKKLLYILASWRDQYKSDSSMVTFANLYKQCRGDGRPLSQSELSHLVGLHGDAKPDASHNDPKTKVKMEKQKEERRQYKSNRHTFNFEKDKPKVLASIVDASQASSNLVNAITLVNPRTDDVETNERVQDCLSKAKEAKKLLVRYIQLVENEEIIGTLIEANERIIAALNVYEQAVAQNADHHSDSESAITKSLAATSIYHEDKTDTRQKDQETSDADLHIHPDLQDLNFGPLGASSSRLPPPLQPSKAGNGNGNINDTRGSLSDFSDYESDDASSGQATRRNFVQVSDNSSDEGVAPSEDPFADPFADEAAVHVH